MLRVHGIIFLLTEMCALKNNNFQRYLAFQILTPVENGPQNLMLRDKTLSPVFVNCLIFIIQLLNQSAYSIG